MKFKKGDRIVVIENGLSGTIIDISFNSIYQSDEYIVAWDNFPNMPSGYDVNDGDTLWEIENQNSFTAHMYNHAKAAELRYGGGGAAQETETIKRCFHEWTEYQGFSENYSYCKKCDEKRMS